MNRLLLVVFGSVLCASGAAVARGAGVEWRELSFPAALEESGRTGTPVLVDVWADHCAQCATMDEEFWPSEDGARLAHGTIPIQIRSDSADGVAFRQRYPILGLPAVILIGPDGVEIDRATGYYSARQFLAEAVNLFEQSDPLPDLEARVQSDPADLMPLLPLLEAYVHRKRIAEAEAILARVLELDPRNTAKQSEKALSLVARYHQSFSGDIPRSQALWQQLVESFPGASSVGQGLKATFEHAQETDSLEAWKAWICEVFAKHPDDGHFAYSVAIWGNRGGLRGGCLSEAARTAHRMKVGPAWMDSLATVLAGR